MSDFQLKAVLTSLSAILFSLFFILLALVLPAKQSYADVEHKAPETEFQKMSKSMRDGFKK